MSHLLLKNLPTCSRVHIWWVRSIKATKPKEKACKLSDSGGLHLEVFPNGAKSWRLKYRIGGKDKRVVFGISQQPATPAHTW
ncbi:hypothetical protein CJP72_23910 [Citrobacter sp. NCU1]|nr:hypothetical protein [Citrobacter sp. NCU1]